MFNRMSLGRIIADMGDATRRFWQRFSCTASQSGAVIVIQF